MRRKYIEDFSELERMLVMDTNFIQYACNGYEDRGLLKTHPPHSRDFSHELGEWAFLRLERLFVL